MSRLTRRWLELRYDGPIPSDALPPQSPVAALKRRILLHLDFLLAYAGQARGQIADGRLAEADRSRRNFTGARRALAVLGGDVRRGMAP